MDAPDKALFRAVSLRAVCKFRNKEGNQNGPAHFSQRYAQRSPTDGFHAPFVISTAVLLGAWFCLTPLSAAQAGVLITIDKATQQMTVEVDGATRWTWPVSTGRRSYETPAGSFKPFRLEGDHYSKEWDEAPMPYSIFFTGEGHAIHGSYETRNLGRRASHGCVRISPRNAEKLFTLVKREGLGNARVVVREDPNAPIMAKRSTPAPKVQQARKAVPSPAPTAIPATPAGAVTTYSTGPANAFGYAPAQPATELPTAAVQSPQPRGPDWN